MSSSSEDEYSNAAHKIQAMKKNWNPDIKIDTVDSDCPSDSDKSPIVVDNPSPKVTKNKKLKKRIPAKKISATDSTGSTESDISRTCSYFTRAQVTTAEPNNSMGDPPTNIEAAASSEPLARSRRSRGNSRRTAATRGTRRSRGRNRFTNAPTVINLGCWSDEEDSSQPIFAKPQAKPVSNDIVEIDTSDLVNYLDNQSSDKESENEELSVKVHWRSKEYHKFNIRKYQKLTKIFEFFSNMEDVAIDHLLLTLGDRVLRPQDTPVDINYNVWHFIEGGVVSHSVSHIAEESAKQYGNSGSKSEANGKKLVIKIQSKDKKFPFKVSLDKDQKFSFAMMRYAEEFELQLANLKFFFDGDMIDGESTPKSLDMEGGECVDVIITP